jgi:hypothetical protein
VCCACRGLTGERPSDTVGLCVRGLEERRVNRGGDAGVEGCWEELAIEVHRGEVGQ